MKVGVIQPLPGIGDMIWHLPALHVLAATAPDGKLTLLTKASSFADQLLAAEPWVADIYYLPKTRGIGAIFRNFYETWLALRKARLGRVYIFHQSFRYRLAAKLAGIGEVIAYPKDLAKSKVNGWVKSRTFLDQLRIPVRNIHPQLSLNPQFAETVRRKFANHPQPWFIASAGAAEMARCWPRDRFAVCVDVLAETLGGTVFLTGAKHETAHVQDVYDLCRHRDEIVPVTDLSFPEFMGLIACSAGMFGNDSGPINVAAALGKPTYALSNTRIPIVVHSPNLLFIEPDLSPEEASGMERITLQHALGVLRAGLGQPSPKARAI